MKKVINQIIFVTSLIFVPTFIQASVSSPTVTIDGIIGSSGTITINYTAYDTDGDSITTAGWQYSLDNTNWNDITEDAINNNYFKPGGSSFITWISTLSIPSIYDDTVWFRMKVVDDKNSGINIFSTNINNIPTLLSKHSSVIYNKFLYITGGVSSNGFIATVYYASLNSDGSVGNFITASNKIPTQLYWHSSVVYNGYIYITGGNTANGALSTVYYAKLNNDGTVGNFNTSNNYIPTTLWSHSSVIYNGYLYITGGGSNGNYFNTIYYAKLNSDGSVGNFNTATNNIPTQLWAHSSVAYNGYLYITGGSNSSRLNTIYYAKLNSDGSVGNFNTATNSIPTQLEAHSSIVYNGYLFITGGYNGSNLNTVYYAKLNSDGSVGNFNTATNNIPTQLWAHSSVAYNGYLYITGGYNFNNLFDTIYYSSFSNLISPSVTSSSFKLDNQIQLQTGTITGKVTKEDGTTALNGATVEVVSSQGLVVNSTMTGTDGTYLFINVSTGTYEIKVQGLGYSNQVKSGIVVTAGQTTTVNFTLSLVKTGYYIKGFVKDTNGTGVSGITVLLTGTTTATYTTGSTGYFEFTNLSAGGVYTVTPVRGMYTFNPLYIDNIQLMANMDNQNFTALLNKYSINGYVTDFKGSGINNTSVELSGDKSASYNTSDTGYYEFFNLNAGGNYTVTPVNNSYTFTPVNLNFTALDRNLSNQNFTAFAVNVTSETVLPIFNKNLISPNGSIRGLVRDLPGNLYITGNTDQKLPGNQNYGQNDIFLIKCDAAGNIIWLDQFGTTDPDTSSDITIDNQGNIFLCGNVSGNFEGNNSAGLLDIFITKYDGNKNRIWSKQFGTSSYDVANGMTIDNTGNIYLTGFTDGSLDGNPKWGEYDIFLIKLNYTGTKLWTKQFGTKNYDSGKKVTLDSSGNIYVTGFVGSGFDGNVNLGQNDIFLAKFNSSGEKLWTRQIGSTNNDSSEDIYIDQFDNIYITGYTEGSLESNINMGATDMFIAKYNVSGDKLWLRQIGTTNSDFGNSIFTDETGNVYVVGSKLTKFNPAGNVIWQKNTGGEYGLLTPDGIIYLAINRDLLKLQLVYAPVLNWSKIDNYTSDGLNPETGDNYTGYIYRVQYLSGDNISPKTGYPKVYIKKDTVNITGSPFTMSAVETTDWNYRDGKEYIYTTLLPAGTSYTYGFEAYDTRDIPAVNVLAGTGPVVNSVTGTVMGKVTKEDGTTPISTATITASLNEISVSVPVDTNGEFQIVNLATGTYRISVQSPGYLAQTRDNVTILSYSTVTVNFTLISLSTSVIDHFEITFPGNNVVAGSNFIMEITARDKNNLRVNYTGSVTLQAVLSADETFAGSGTLGIVQTSLSNGVATITNQYYTKGEKIKIKVVDTNNITGLSPVLSVVPSYNLTISLSANPVSVLNNQPVQVTVQLQDYYRNQITGTPINFSLVQGRGTFNVSYGITDNNGKFTVVFTPSLIGSGICIIRATSGNELKTEITISVSVLVTAANGGIIIADEDPYTKLNIPPGMFNTDVQMQINYKRNVAVGEGQQIEITASEKDTNNKVTDFIAPVDLVFHYQIGSEGKITNTEVDKNQAGDKISLFYYDGVKWQKIGGTVDTVNQTVTAKVTHLSLYAIKQTSPVNKFQFSGIGPNPFTPNPDGVYDRVYFYFDNPESKEVAIRIFDLSKSIVRELNIEPGVVPYWDGRNQDGQLVEGGIYVYQLKVGTEIIKGTVVLAK